MEDAGAGMKMEDAKAGIWVWVQAGRMQDGDKHGGTQSGGCVLGSGSCNYTSYLIFPLVKKCSPEFLVSSASLGTITNSRELLNHLLHTSH